MVLIEPIAQNSFWFVVSLKASVKASISIGSPNLVPVPWASTYVILSALISAFLSASHITSTCPRMLGAVNPIFSEPSLFIDEDFTDRI